MEPIGKSVIVTGGASGIGKSIVERLAAESANIGVFDIDLAATERLQRDLPAVYCRHCDVADSVQVASAVDDFYTRFGDIHVLINNAGTIHNSLLVNMEKDAAPVHDIEMWDRVIAVNLSSVFYVTLHVVRKMLLKRTKGLIINISSISAAGNMGQSAYSAAKAGVSSLVVTWAKELGLLGIRVAGIAPGFTRTDAAISSMSEETLSEWVERTPLRRLAKPAEIADAVLFIMRNDFFNGRILEIDGGLRI